jgi:hypothetical protein
LTYIKDNKFCLSLKPALKFLKQRHGLQIRANGY